MRSKYFPLKQKAISLRKSGLTYGDIRNELGLIPKSTLSNWFRGIELSDVSQEKINARGNAKLIAARKKARAALVAKRKEYLDKLDDDNSQISLLLKSNKEAAKICLSVLYQAEGTKSSKGSVTFGNSEPGIVELFLGLMRQCYELDESKFRCTLQGREDQDLDSLKKFWSEITKIPLSQFYGTRIDPRSIGKKSKKRDYKGVCRIDYYSAHVYHDLMCLARLVNKSYSPDNNLGR